MNGYEIFCFLNNVVLEKGGKRLLTPDRSMVFFKNGKIEMLAPSFEAIPVLKLKFNDDQVYELLNFAWENNFAAEIVRENRKILASGDWYFVAIGYSRDKQASLGKAQGIGIGEETLRLIPEKLFTNSDTTILSGKFREKIVSMDLNLSKDRIEIPLFRESKISSYEISENGPDIYYLDVICNLNDKIYYLLFERR
jgi:hypothetical protein